jgi:hypothetical protein
MAIAEVAEDAHLSGVDIEALAAELEAMRVDIEDSRGARPTDYRSIGSSKSDWCSFSTARQRVWLSRSPARTGRLRSTLGHWR